MSDFWASVKVLTPTSFTFPRAAVPAQTGEGIAVWDTDDDLLTIGHGAGRRTMVDLSATQIITGGKTMNALTLGGNLAGGGFAVTNVIYVDLPTAAAPAAPGVGVGRFYVVTGDRPGFRSAAAGAAEVLVTRDAVETLTGKTLTAPTINGTVATTGLTLPAFTLSGAVAGGAQAVTNLASIAGQAAATSLLLAGAADSAAARNIVIQTNNLAGTGLVTRVTIGSNATTAVVTWANVTHTGIVLSGSVGGGGNTVGTTTSTLAGIIVGGTNTAISLAVNTSYFTMRGGVAGVAGDGALIALYGKASGTGAMELYTSDAAGTADVLRLKISGNLATSVVTWSSVTHTGIVLTASEKIYPTSGVAGFSIVSTALTLGSSGSIIIPYLSQTGAAFTDAIGGNVDGAIGINYDNDTGPTTTLEARSQAAWVSVALTGYLMQNRVPWKKESTFLSHPKQMYEHEGRVWLDESRCYVCGEKMLPGEQATFWANGPTSRGVHTIFGHTHLERDSYIKGLEQRVADLEQRLAAPA